MVAYALNLFDILPGKESTYRQYSIEAGRIIFGLGGKVICSGWHPKTLRGDEMRSHFILVEFPSEDVFRFFLESPDHQSTHQLREDSTTNYIWKLFEPWDLKTWVAFPGVR